MNVPETTSEIKIASRTQIARAIAQGEKDRNDPRLAKHPNAKNISAALDDLTAALDHLDTLIKTDSETHP